jgi:hypothetical protein
MNRPLRMTEAGQLSPGANARHVRVRGDAGVLAGQAGQIRETVDLLSVASARVFSTSGTDKPRANPAITSDSGAFRLRDGLAGQA